MNLPHGDFKKNALISASVCLAVYLLIIRSILLFVPVFALVIFFLWKRGGGKMESWEDDDPADWWKKGKHWGGWKER